MTLETVVPPNSDSSPLPSERFEPGSNRQIGFADHPSEAHIRRSSSVLQDLVATANAFPQRGERPLEICFCHVRYAPPLPLNLFAFHIWDVDDSGEMVDSLERGRVRYAITVNLPVPLQLEVALSFLFELLSRQKLLGEIHADEERFLNIEEETRHSDTQARIEVNNRLRYGWLSAAQAVMEEAASQDLSLNLRYELDVFPDEELIFRRVPHLRQAYNELDLVRDMVDKTVSSVGGRAPSVRATGGAESMRDWTQQHMALLDVRTYFNHALRDAEVAGNGYVGFTEGPAIAPYCLRPDKVRILPGPRGRLRGNEWQSIRAT